jgi:acyl-CoA synthetase (AMP-forming)/AMP-acid ligase II
MEGYFEKPDATRAVVRDGWLWTGDLGYVSGGHLYVTGRAKDVVVVRGRNYHAEDLESTAERVEGVRAGGCVAFGRYDEGEARDRVVLVCETRLSEDADRRELERRVFEAVQTECGLSVDEVVLVPPRTIPKTSSGKRQRWRCRELYLRNELEPPRRDELRKAILRSAAGHAMMRVRGLIGARSDD